MKKNGNLLKRALGMMLALTTCFVSIPMDALAAAPVKIDSEYLVEDSIGFLGGAKYLDLMNEIYLNEDGITFNEDGLVEVTKELDISTESGYEDLDWVDDPYPLDLLIVDPDPEIEQEEPAMEEDTLMAAPELVEEPYIPPYYPPFEAPDVEDFEDVEENYGDFEEPEYIEDPECLEDAYYEEESLMAAVQSGDFEYTLSNDEATISKYIGTDEDVVIPDEIDGYTVVAIGRQAFYNQTSIKSVTMPDTVTSIGNQAFYYCSAMETIKFSSGLQKIGDYAFQTCNSLKSLTFSEGLTEIGYNAFYNCIALTSVTLPEGLLKIRGYAFRDCIAMTEIVIPSSVTAIESYAFENSAKKITFADGITVIPNSALCGANRLETVVLPDTVTKIGNNAFLYCSKLVDVTIPDAVTEIGNSAFWNCEALTSVTLPEGLLKIGGYAFRYCSGITEITIPASVTTIENNAFEGAVKKVIFAEGTTQIPNNALQSASNLESAVIPDTVTKIGNYAFYGCSKLESVTIPENVTEIGNDAFWNCEKITKITLPDGIQKIGNNAFSSCKALGSITLPDGLTSIGSSCFAYCSALTEITIPSSVTSIGGYAFNNSVKKIIFADGTVTIPDNACYSANNLETVVIPDSVTKIGKNAFYYCELLTAVKLPDGVTEIGGYAFQNCKALTTVTLPEGLLKIGGYAFRYCTAITEITIPASVTTIEGSAFTDSVNKAVFAKGTTIIPKDALNGANNLESVVIPDTVEKIENNAFYNCKKLEEVSLPDGLKELGSSVFGNCQALKSISLPEGLTSIGSSCFNYCSALAEIKLPSTLTTVGSSAFANSVKKLTFAKNITAIPENTCNGANNLESVVIPDTVEKIGKHAFYNCQKLKDVSLPASIKELGVGAFYCCKEIEAVTLPEGLTTIGSDCFRSCAALTEITLPASLTTVENNAFNNSVKKVTFAAGTTAIAGHVCHGANLLETVVIPDTVTSIGEYAFANCSKLSSFALTDKIESIGSNAFYGCTGLTEITLPACVKSIGSNAFYNSAKKFIFADGTTEIPANICYNSSYLEEVQMPDTVKAIGDCAFYNCKKLTTMKLSQNIESIGEKAFYGCTFEEFEFPKNLKTIGTSAFYGCTNLKAIVLPEGLTTIGDSAFYICTAMISALIPSTIETIGRSAFFNSTKGIIFAQGIKKIPENACNGATALTEVAIPFGVQEIGDNAFYGCTKLERVDLPEGLTKVGAAAFYGDTLCTVYIPDSLVEMAENCFAGCIIAKKCGQKSEWQYNPEDKSATIIGSGEVGDESGNIFGNFEDEVAFVEVEEGITEITGHSFEGMENLSGVVIGDNVKEIGVQAFDECENLERVELSKNLETINEKAFQGCENIDTVIFTGNLPEIDDTALPTQSFTAYFPKSSDTYTDDIKNKYNYVDWKMWDDTLPKRDVILVLDVSGSMSGERIRNLKTAVCAFADKVGGRLTNTRIGIVTFASDARRVMPFSTDVTRMKSATQRMSANGGTYYLKGFTEADKLMEEAKAGVKSIILFSDGEPSDSRNTILAKASDYRAQGYYMYSVGLKPSDNNRNLLINIAGDEANYFEADDIDALIAKFVEVSEGIGRSGSCGDNVRWRYNDSSKQLVISLDKKIDGKGKMQDFTADSPAPWDAYADTLQKISIESGVTYIGKGAFANLKNVTSAQIDKSVVTIADGAFGNGNKLNTVYYSGSEADWKKISIGSNNDALKKATIKYNTDDPDQPSGKVTGVVIKPSTVSIGAGEDVVLKAEVTPKKAKNKAVTWKTDDPSIAKVDKNGKVTGVKTGATKVTATTEDGGFVATCAVKVTNSTPVISKFEFGPDSELSIADNIPFFGGMSFAMELPDVLGVNCVVEDNTIKLGINVPKHYLYYSDSEDKKENAKTMNKKSFKEKFEEFKKTITMRDLPDEYKDWLDTVQEKKIFNAKVPGVKKAVDFDVIGYVEGAFSEGKMESLSGTLVVVIEGTGSVEAQATILFIPVTVNCEVTAEGKISATVGYNFKDAKWYGDLELAATLSLEPYAGIGFGEALSGGVYGKGESTLVITLLSSSQKSGVKEWTLYGEIGIKGYLAGMSASKALLKPDKEWVVYRRKSNTKGFLSAEDEITASEESSDYEMIFKTLAPTMGIQSLKVASDGILVADAYNAADPELVSAGGTTLAVYVTDDLTRGDLDKTKLVYSIYDPMTDTYASPLSVLDDGTADYNPEVYTDGKDIYLTWLDASKTFDGEPEFVEYISYFKTHVAKYDASSKKFVDLGTPQSNTVYTYLPKLYKAGDELSLAWVENSENAMFGLSKDNTVYRSVYKNGAWLTPAAEASGVNAVRSLALGEASGDNGISLAYAVDKDNDLTTKEHDFLVKSGKGKASVVGQGSIAAITYTELPSVSGKVIAANVNGGLKYVSGNALVELLPEQTMGTETAYEVSGNKVLYLVNDAQTRNIAVASYDGGEWGSALLTHEDGYVDHFSVADGKVAYLFNVASPAGDSTWDLSSTVKVLGSTDYNDTELESVDFALDDAYAGGVLPVQFYVKNNGTSRVNRVHASVTYDGTEIASSDIDVDVKSGASKPYEFAFTVPSSITENSKLVMTLTSANDQDASNDSKTISIAKADLSVSAKYDASGVKPIIDVKVVNRGLVDSNMTLTVKDKNGAVLFTKTGAVQAGDMVEFKEAYTGSIQQTCTVSVTSSAPEFYESNNVTWVEVGGKQESVPVEEDSFIVRFDELSSDSYNGLVYNEASGRYEVNYTGSAIKPSVAVSGLMGTLKEGVDYTVSYSNNVNAGKNGKAARVTVTGKGNYQGKKTLDFYIMPVDLSVANAKGLLTVPESLTVAGGKKANPVIAYKSYTLKSADMTLSSSGAIKADTNITVSGKGNFTGSIPAIPVKVLSAKEANEITIKAKVKSAGHVYTGKPQTLICSTPGIAGELTVTAGSSKTVLKEGKDYTVKYSSNVNAGTAKAVVTGRGDYIGSATVSFKILPDKTSAMTASVEGGSVAFKAGGVTPAVTVMAAGVDEPLTEGVDYKVAYTNNKKVGTGKYNLTFLGNYKGHAPVKNQTFTITAGSFDDAKAVSADMIYKKPGKYLSAPYVTIDGVQLTSKDYTVKYFDGTKELTAKDKITLGEDEASKAITVKVTGKGNYQAQEITTSYLIHKDGAVNLTKAKIVAKDKVKGKDVAVSKQEYTGNEVTPEIRVLVKNGKSWDEVPSSAYTVNYINNVAKGNATILVTGNGKDAVGSKSSKFVIGAKNIGLFKFLFGL